MCLDIPPTSFPRAQKEANPGVNTGDPPSFLKSRRSALSFLETKAQREIASVSLIGSVHRNSEESKVKDSPDSPRFLGSQSSPRVDLVGPPEHRASGKFWVTGWTFKESCS